MISPATTSHAQRAFTSTLNTLRNPISKKILVWTRRTYGGGAFSVRSIYKQFPTIGSRTLEDLYNAKLISIIPTKFHKHKKAIIAHIGRTIEITENGYKILC